MIFDKIENVGRYVGISENLDKALRYLANNDLSLLQNGKSIIDGDNVFVNVMQATTNPDTEREYEFHEEYYDIQIDIKGTEEVWFGTEYQQLTQPYQKERDIGFGKCRCEAVCRLSPGRFVICEPGEPHMPGVAPDGKAEQIYKAVMKVHK